MEGDTWACTWLDLRLFVAVSLVCCFGAATYRIYCHPLNKYPGPFICKLTDMYYAYILYRGDVHVWLYEMQKRHGPFLRYGPNKVLINTPEALHDIYDKGRNVRKAQIYEVFRVHNVENTFNATNEEVHGRKRRILGQAFSDRWLKGVESRVLSHIDGFCDYLAEPFGSASDQKGETDCTKNGHNMAIKAWHFIFDITADLCFGRNFDLLGKEKERFMKQYISDSLRRDHTATGFFKLHSWGLDRLVPQIRRLVVNRDKLHSWMQEKALSRILSASQQNDFFTYMLGYKDPETGSGFAMTEYWQEAAALLIAGADTPSHSIAATLFFLCKHPRALGRVVEELQLTFTAYDGIRSGPQLSSCVWLKASILEAMRLSTPAPAPIPREVLSGGITVCGEYFPAGVEIGISPYNYMHQASLFPDPERYDPTRWIVKPDGSNAEEVSRLRRHNAIFSTGHRQCIGKNLALMEMHITMARLLWRFEPEILSDGPKQETWKGTGSKGLPEYKYLTRLMAHGDGPYMRFSPRSHSVAAEAEEDEGGRGQSQVGFSKQSYS